MAEQTFTKQRGHHPVWFSLGRGLIEVGTGVYCIVQQFNTTRDSIFGLLQGGTQIPAQMNAQQLLNFLNGNAGKYNTIAFTVALVTQVVFWWVALPATKNGYITRWRQGIALLMFGLEILSDITYAASTQVQLGPDLLRIFDTGNFAWIGVALFAISLSYGSTFVFLNGIRVIGNVFENNAD